MSESTESADVVNAERFEKLGVIADAGTAARVREQFAHWLREFFDLDAVKTNDLVLAANEALTNAAEFAYLCGDQPGTMDMQARYLPDDGSLVVTVADNGRWRMPDPAPATRTRGRGIPLMHALSDRATIETTEQGTRACLEWTGIQRS